MATLVAVKPVLLPSSPTLPRPVGSLRARLPWPLPALGAWAGAWLAYTLFRQAGLWPGLAWALAAALGALPACFVSGRWRAGLVLAGFPLSSLALGVAVPAWWWLLAALPLALAYPLRAWSDAPFFPTPRRALHELAPVVNVAPDARMLDAGCGLGHGLRAMQALWPGARIEGVEWSAPLAWWCARRCPQAVVSRADMWVHPWSGYALVYLFQRPESMARAWTKACAEMDAGSWLVSLEFAVPGVEPQHRLDAGGGRPLWAYRVPELMPGRSKKTRRGR